MLIKLKFIYDFVYNWGINNRWPWFCITKLFEYYVEKKNSIVSVVSILFEQFFTEVEFGNHIFVLTICSIKYIPYQSTRHHTNGFIYGIQSQSKDRHDMTPKKQPEKNFILSFLLYDDIIHKAKNKYLKK